MPVDHDVVNRLKIDDLARLCFLDVKPVATVSARASRREASG